MTQAIQDAFAASMGRLIGEEIARLREFIGLLRDEQEMLKQQGGELAELIAAKNELIATLNALTEARLARLPAYGLTADAAGMHAWLERQASEGERDAWSWLCELADEARALNALNGKLISLHMQHNQQALTALLAAADKVNTYGPDGQRQTGLDSRMLGKA